MYIWSIGEIDGVLGLEQQLKHRDIWYIEPISCSNTSYLALKTFPPTLILQQTTLHKSHSNDSFLYRLKNLLQRIPLARQSISLLGLSKLKQSSHPIRVLHILQQILRLVFSLSPTGAKCKIKLYVLYIGCSFSVSS